jgi:transposase
MKAVLERCAGIDVGKKALNVCVMTGAADHEPKGELRLFGTFNAELDKLRQWLIETGCTHAVMESTGSYWKPVYAALEDSGINVILANGEDVKARRGHKTDWADCQFLANLLRHGLIRASFIPPRAIRDLRDLTRRHRMRDHHRRLLRFSVQGITAAALLAETGADMSVFPTEGNLSSWAGVCPGNRISAGKNRSGAIPRGNKWARTTLVECAWAAAAKKDCHLKERFRRLCVKGRKTALIAVAHDLAVIVHQTLKTGTPYREPDQPAPDERKRQRLIRHYVRRLGKLGIAVSSLSPEPAKPYRSSAGTRTQHVRRRE